LLAHSTPPARLVAVDDLLDAKLPSVT
jgi:hypothetical protein